MLKGVDNVSLRLWRWTSVSMLFEARFRGLHFSLGKLNFIVSVA